MKSDQEFRYELDVRQHARSEGAMFLIMLVTLPAAFLIAGALDASFMKWALVVFGGLFVLFHIVIFMPMSLRGGMYRVVVHNSRLRVESPHWAFGKSFDVDLAEIARLVILETADATEYKVFLYDGRVFLLSGHMPAKQLFETIRRCHPEIPIEGRDWRDR